MELRGEVGLGKVPVFANLTFLDPKATGPGDDGGSTTVRIGDIAGFGANLGLRLPLWTRANLSFRWSYVGSRRTGEGTTVATNPLRRIDAYSVANASLTYRDAGRGASVQLIVDNLFDRSYSDPGVLLADGFNLASSVPQPGRRVYLRISWGLGSPKPGGAGPGA